MTDVDKSFQNQTWLKLSQAIKNYDIEQVNFLLATECIEDKFINLALFNAVRYSYVEIVQLLINSGANINHIFGLGTALTEAIDGEHIEIIDILLDKGADCNIPYHGEVYPPLFVAIDQGNLEIVKKLIKAGANVNAKDEEGYTPLMLAVQTPALEDKLSEGERNSTTKSGQIWGKVLFCCGVSCDQRCKLIQEASGERIAPPGRVKPVEESKVLPGLPALTFQIYNSPKILPLRSPVSQLVGGFTISSPW